MIKDFSTSRAISPKEEEKGETESPLSIQEILKAENIVDILDNETLQSISQQVQEDYNNDLQSNSKRLKEMKEIIELAMLIAHQKSYPWTGAANIIFPLVANACISFGSSCYPEIIKDGEIVKAKIIGSDEGSPMIDPDEGTPMIDPTTNKPIMEFVGAKQKRGERISKVMNYQLMEEQTWWEKDTDKLVHALPCVADMFRKVYYDPIREMPVCELIFPDKMIINNMARDIDSAIVTQIIELYPQEIMQRIRSGVFAEFDFEAEDNATDTLPPALNSDLQMNSGTSINTKLHIFLEQHTWLDLDDDGFLEPYIVTVHSNSSKIVRIVPRFRKEDIKYNSKKQIKDIKATKFFVHYSFLPSPDGSFFSMGFGHLLLNINKGINSTINQLLDAGHLQVTGGGFISKGIKMKGGRVALAPGEWRIVDVGGDDLARGIVPLPMPQPSPVLFTLLGGLIDAGKQLGSLLDVLNGQNAGNIPATTMISMVEQGLKQFKSIYKRIYKSEKDEFRLLYELNAGHLGIEKYAEILDEPLLEVDIRGDFDKKGYDICPVADIEAVTSFQRMSMAQFYMSFLSDPAVDAMELRRRIFESVNAPDIEKLITPPPAPINPLLEVEQLRQQTKQQELAIKAQEAFANVEELKLKLQLMEAQIVEVQAKSMLSLAQAAETSKETELKEQTESIKVLDNQIDAQVKQIEVEGRRQDAQMKHEIEQQKLNLQVAKLGHEHMQNVYRRQYESEVSNRKNMMKQPDITKTRKKKVATPPLSEIMPE